MIFVVANTPCSFKQKGISTLIFVKVYYTPAGDRDELQALLQDSFLDRLSNMLSSEEKSYTRDDIAVVLRAVSNAETNMRCPYFMDVELPYTKHLAGGLHMRRIRIEKLLEEVVGDDAVIRLHLDFYVTSSSRSVRELLTQ